MDFQQKNKIRKFFYSQPVVGIVVLIALYSVYSTWSIYRKMVQSREQMEKSQQDILALEAKNNRLQADIDDLQTEKGIAKEIRSKFGQALPDERMAVIVEESPATSSVDTVHMSLWAKFLHLLGM